MFVCLFQRTGPCPNRPRKEQTYRFGFDLHVKLGGAEHSDVAASEALHVALVQLAVLLDGVVQPARQDVELVVVHGIEGAASWDLLHGEGNCGVICGSRAVVVGQHRHGGAASKAQLARLDAHLHAVAGLHERHVHVNACVCASVMGDQNQAKMKDEGLGVRGQGCVWGGGVSLLVLSTGICVDCVFVSHLVSEKGDLESVDIQGCDGAKVANEVALQVGRGGTRASGKQWEGGRRGVKKMIQAWVGKEE